jgi:hypothetical protein
MSLRSLSCLVLLLFSLPMVGWRQALSEQQGSSSSRSSNRQKSAMPLGDSAHSLGAVADGLYRNSAFGFRYKIPVGWVDRTADMSAEAPSSEAGKSVVLLAIFARPPAAAGETVNSAVIIAAESMATYPGWKSAADYFEAISQLTTSKGFKAVNEPFEFSAGMRSLVRGDFSKELGKLTMYQASLAMVQKGYATSFTFLAGSEDEVEELIERLSFTGAKLGAAAKPRSPH